MPSVDRIERPPYDHFIDTPIASAAEGYYATLLHELVHWTSRPDTSATRSSCNVDASRGRGNCNKGGTSRRRWLASIRAEAGRCRGRLSALKRGKDIVTIDLASQSGRSHMNELISGTDVLVTQSRPGILEKLGLAATDLIARYPRLIVCSISGYGQNGPRAHESGHDLNYVASAGLLGLGSAPTVPPVLLADIAGGTYPAVINILLALRQRDITGTGSHLDISMTDAMFVFAWEALASRWGAGSVPPDRLRFNGTSPRYRHYATRDDRFIVVAALEERFWQRFVKVIGLEPRMPTIRMIHPPRLKR